MSKKGFEFSFGWMFAVIVGAAVIFLAIYASSRFIPTAEQATNAVAGESFASLLSPVETGIETGKASQISTNALTRIYFGCDSAGTFGAQEISASVSSGIGNTWEKPYITSEFHNKYIFSKKEVEGKTFYAIAETFSYPFKVADIMIVFSEQDKYCFVNAPSEVVNTLNTSALPTLQFTSSIASCTKGTIKVCFTNSGCDVDVSLNSKSVRKNSATLYYGHPTIDFGNDALIYGAIFADTSIYECQVKRLAERISALSDVYQSKERFMGCNSNIGTELISLKNGADSLSSSVDLKQIALSAGEVDAKNEAQICKLY